MKKTSSLKLTENVQTLITAAGFLSVVMLLSYLYWFV